MKDERQDQSKQSDDSALSTLLNLAGPTAEISPQIEKRVYANVRGEWSRTANRPRAARWVIPFALAATVLIAVLINDPVTDTARHAIGTVASSGDEVFVGDVIDTDVDSGMSIWLNDEISLRVDQDTVLSVVAADKFELMAGRVYIDTGDRIYSDRHITIVTASGRATDIGTQFSVSYDDADMSVAVREGRVDLTGDRESRSAVRGQKLTLRAGQAIQVGSVELVGPEWDWAVALAPEFALEEHSLLDFLKWVSRETGLELVFNSDDVRAAARISRAYGSIEGLTPLEAVEAVLATTQFRYSIDGNTISIAQ
jgi:ferric-dicitrate binding protein FerR (iron transport regulator)